MEESIADVYQNILNSPHLSTATREVFLTRLAIPEKREPEFFSAEAFRLLIAVSDCLFPQDKNKYVVDLAGLLDTSMHAGEGDGWRFADTISDQKLLQQGIENVDRSSLARFDRGFLQLEYSEQNVLLKEIQFGKVDHTIWKEINSARFFEELLIRLTEIFYSHPFTRLSIGELSAFDKPGWLNTSADERDWDLK